MLTKKYRTSYRKTLLTRKLLKCYGMFVQNANAAWRYWSK